MWGFNEWGSSFCGGWGASFGNGPLFMGWLFPLIFWGLIAYLLFGVLKNLLSGTHSGQSDSAFEILRNRFASGEINEQEYNAQKAILKRG